MSSHHDRGRFSNPWPGGRAPAGARDLFRWWFVERLRHPRPPDADPATFPRASPRFAVPRAGDDQVTITWVGHATFLIQIAGLNVLTDPMWSERASPIPGVGPKRKVAPAVPFEELPPIDVVLQSHDHYDHLDDLTVCRLEAREPGARWVVPLGLRAWLRRRGVRDIIERDWWQDVELGPLTLGCTPACHFSGRAPWQRNRTLWCGWSLAGAGRRLFFAGDTGYHPEFAEVARRYGPFDVALLPIGAYEPQWLMQPVHLNPEESVRAARELGARRLIPMHWGTFKLTDEPLDEPPQRALATWCAAGMAAEHFWQLAHGETRELPADGYR